MVGGMRRLARPSTRISAILGALALVLAGAPVVEGIAQIQCPSKFSSSATAGTFEAGRKAEYSFCPVLNMQCTSPKVTCASTDNDGDGYLSKEEIFCSFVSLWDGPELLGLDPTTDVAQARSPFADAGTISVEGQIFSLAFALSGPKGSDWRSAVDCDAVPSKSPFCFAAFTSRLDTNKDGKWSVEECEAASEAASTAVEAAAAYGRRVGNQDSKEGARVNRRQGLDSAMAKRLVEAGVYQAGDPSAGEYFPKEEQPWFLKPGASGAPFEITGWIYLGICITWFLCMCYIRITTGTFDSQKSIEMTVALQAVALALWFFYDYSFMCARFGSLLTDERFDYEVWGTNYEKEDEMIHWLSREWFKASDQTLIEHECPTKKSLLEQDAQPVPGDACNIGPSLWFSADILRQNDSVEMVAQKASIGIGLLLWPVLYAIRAFMKITRKIFGSPPWFFDYKKQCHENEIQRLKSWKDHMDFWKTARYRGLCRLSRFLKTGRFSKYYDCMDLDTYDQKFLDETESGKLIRRGLEAYQKYGYVFDGIEPDEEDQFWDAVTKERERRDQFEPTRDYRYWGWERDKITVLIQEWIFFTVFTVLLGVQQSVVVLPITSARINPYCMILNVPSSQRYGACIHKWSATGLPYGILLVLGGLLVGTVLGVCRRLLFRVKKRMRQSDSVTGANFGTSDEAVPVDVDGGIICYIEENGGPCVLSTKTVSVQGRNFGQTSMQTSSDASSEASSEASETCFEAADYLLDDCVLIDQWMFASDNADEKDEFQEDACCRLCALPCLAVAVLPIGLGALLISIWLFGGIVIGLWFAYAEIFDPLINISKLDGVELGDLSNFVLPAYQDLSVIKNVIVPTVVIGPPIVSFFLVVINALFLTIFCGWKGKNTDADEQEETPYRRAVRRQIELDDIVMEKLQPKWDREEAEEKEQKAQEALEKRKKRKERKERFNKGVPHDVKKKRKERKERANKGVPHDAHQEMDTNTSPAFQMAPRSIGAAAPTPPTPPMAGYPPMAGLTGFPTFFPSPLGYAGSPPPGLVAPRPPAARGTENAAAPAMSTGNAALVPPAPPILPSAALDFSSGMPSLPPMFGGSPPYMVGMPPMFGSPHPPLPF